MRDLTAFQRDLLFVINGLEDDQSIDRELPHGIAVNEGISGYYKEPINHGRLYPNLDRLVDMGLVSKESIDERTNGYTLTARGRRVLEDRREWESAHL